MDERAPASPPDWTGAMGDFWAENADHFERMLADIGAALLAAAAFRPGERVVEIGCGAGGLTRAIAAAVAPSGEAVGLDVSPALLRLARDRAGTAPGIRFVLGDAAAMLPEGVPFDRLVSRFGVMFFADPPAAMANLRRMLRPGGRLDFAVWAAPEANPWSSAVMALARRHLDLPAPPQGAPGPFAMADPELLAGLLGGAGFTDVQLTAWRGVVHLGPPGTTPEMAVESLIRTSPLSEPWRTAPDDIRARLRADLERLVAPHVGPGGFAMPAAAHLVKASAAD